MPKNFRKEKKRGKSASSCFFPPAPHSYSATFSPLNASETHNDEGSTHVSHQHITDLVLNMNGFLKKKDKDWSVKAIEISDNKLIITPMKNKKELKGLNLTASFTEKTVTGTLDKQALHDNLDQMVATFVEMYIQANGGYIPKQASDICIGLTPPDEDLMKKLKEGVDTYLTWANSIKPEPSADATFASSCNP